MRIERNKQWWLDRARREGVEVIGAGLVARDPISDSQSVTRAPTPREDKADAMEARRLGRNPNAGHEALEGRPTAHERDMESRN